MFELKFAAEVSDLTGTWAVGVDVSLPWYLDSINEVLIHFQHWLKNQARASQVNCSLDGCQSH